MLDRGLRFLELCLVELTCMLEGELRRDAQGIQLLCELRREFISFDGRLARREELLSQLLDVQNLAVRWNANLIVVRALCLAVLHHLELVFACRESRRLPTTPSRSLCAPTPSPLHRQLAVYVYV